MGNIVSVEFGSVVKPISMALWFQSTELMNIDFTNLDTSNTTSMAFLFDRCTKLKSVDMRGLDTSKVVSFNSMFDHSALENINMSMLDTSSVIRMNSMFNNCRNIVTLDITGWDTSKVESMEEMFYQCEMTELDLCSFSSESLDNTTNMFTENEELETIYVSSAFDCGNVSHSTGMFHNCIALVGGMGTSYDTNHKDKTYAKIDGGVGDEGYFTECN